MKIDLTNEAFSELLQALPPEERAMDGGRLILLSLYGTKLSIGTSKIPCTQETLLDSA